MRFLRFATSTVLAATLLTGGIQGTAAEVRVAETDGQVSFVPNDRDPTEVLPPDPGPDGPDVEIPPIGPDGQTGPLTIAYAPTLDFGTQEISNRDAVYSMVAEKQQLADTQGEENQVPYVSFAQVQDTRGSNAGWRLTVKQNGQFKNENTLNQELTGSVIKLTEPAVKSNALGVTAPVPTETITLDASGSEAIVMTAAAQSGAGTWVNAWGAVETVRENDSNGQEVESAITKAISLTVPGNTPKDAVSYETTLTWTLSDTPGNEV